MQLNVSTLTAQDVRSVDALMKRDSATLGFLPLKALIQYQKSGGILGAKTSNNELVGYLLYSIHHTYFRIFQLCVSEHHRGKKIAKKLVDHLRNSATTQRLIMLRCRRDFPATNMWPILGFVPLEEKAGRSASGYPLTLWCLTLARDPQLDLFQASTFDERLGVVVDAQIFFDLFELESHKTLPSKTLQSDFLADILNLWITDELLVEIDRKKDSTQRKRSQQRAHDFRQIVYNPVIASYFEKTLRKFLPFNTRSQLSDIRHLAKTAASDSKTFITRDGNLLKRSDEIRDLINIDVVSPTQLIIGIYDAYKKSGAQCDRISGTDVSWRRITSADIAKFPASSFVDPGEKHAPFLTRLNSFVAQPDKYQCTLLQRAGCTVAFRILSTSKDNVLTVLFVGVTRVRDRELIERFIASDTIATAIAASCTMVRIKRDAPLRGMIPALIDTGFVEQCGVYYRCTLPCSMSRQQASAQISQVVPDIRDLFLSMSDLKLERHCSPLDIEGARQAYLIPIRPGYAMSLFDQIQASQDLLGANTNVLFRWENIYYRKATHTRILKAPGRIFWYVSSPKSSIVAVSHLDEVHIDIPKKLFRAFEKFGILDWRAIYEMCGGDISMRLMAMKFSHTFILRQHISLPEIRRIYSENGKVPALQSPSRIPVEICKAIIKHGYESQP